MRGDDSVHAIVLSTSMSFCMLVICGYGPSPWLQRLISILACVAYVPLAVLAYIVAQVLGIGVLTFFVVLYSVYRLRQIHQYEKEAQVAESNS